MAKVRNVVIIGAGPAGLASAIYLQRAGLVPLVLERDKPGGLLRNANLVENYPGFKDGIPGSELAARIAEHAERLGIEVRKESAQKVRLVERIFAVKTDSAEHKSRAVIIASGTSPITPRIPGMSRLLGREVFLDMVSIRLPHKEDRHFLILGGGDAAFDYAINLRERGYRATIISRSKPRCLPLLQERALDRGVVLRQGVIVELMEETLRGLMIRCRAGGRRFRLYGDAVLVAYGRTPELGMIDQPLMRRVGTPESPPASAVPGLYLAGDVVRGNNRQTGIAVGDGILAGMLAERFVAERNG